MAKFNKTEKVVTGLLAAFLLFILIQIVRYLKKD
jgi:hypothetical protein